MRRRSGNASVRVVVVETTTVMRKVEDGEGVAMQDHCKCETSEIAQLEQERSMWHNPAYPPAIALDTQTERTATISHELDHTDGTTSGTTKEQE
jgi:hypothetical protein